jgi:hypothetical protein
MASVSSLLLYLASLSLNTIAVDASAATICPAKSDVPARTQILPVSFSFMLLA